MTSVLDGLREMKVNNDGKISLEGVCVDILPERVSPLGSPLIVDGRAAEGWIATHLKSLPKANAYCMTNYRFNVIPHAFDFKSIQFYEVK